MNLMNLFQQVIAHKRVFKVVSKTGENCELLYLICTVYLTAFLN